MEDDISVFEKNELEKQFDELFNPNDDVNFEVDEFETLILRDVMAYDKNLAIKLERNLSGLFRSWIESSLMKKRAIRLNWKGTTRSGKSYGAIAVAYKITKDYNILYTSNRQFIASHIIAGNQAEFMNRLKNIQFSEAIVIDEKLFGEAGIGSNQMEAQLRDIENVIAKHNTHISAITPKSFLSNGSILGLATWGRDDKKWLSRFLVYDLRSSIPQLLGYVIIDIKPLYEDFGCKIYKKTGGCANPNRYTLKDGEFDEYLPFPKTSTEFNPKTQFHNPELDTVSEHNKDNVPELSLDEIKEKIILDCSACPFYKICNLPMAEYERKKDSWIDRELTGGIPERLKERVKTALLLLEHIAVYDVPSDSIFLNSSNKKETLLKVRLALPKITNIRMTEGEIDEILTIVFMSIKNANSIKDLSEQCGLNYEEVFKKIPLNDKPRKSKRDDDDDD